MKKRTTIERGRIGLYLSIFFISIMSCHITGITQKVVLHATHVIRIESCHDETILAVPLDTIILKVKNALGGGGYSLALDTLNIDKKKMMIYYDLDKKFYQSNAYVIQEYRIIPLESGDFVIPIVYKRPWDSEPLQRCRLLIHLTLKANN